jgi:hypothetical protein
LSMKECTKCGKTKKESQYYKNPRTLDGLRSECKECSKAGTSQYRKRMSEKKEDYVDVLFREVITLAESLFLKIAELESVCKKRRF